MTASPLTATPAALESLADRAGVQPWSEWITGTGAGTNEHALLAWLEHLDQSLPQRAAECREDEQRLATLWQHMVPKLGQFLPDEVTHVVASQLEASARRGAAEALIDMVQLERQRLGDRVAMHREDGPLDESTLRRLLDGIASDRATTGRALTAEVLETLCSITLDLEVTERRVGDSGNQLTETLADLRAHVIEAADGLRALPVNVAVRTQANEQIMLAVNRCLERFAGTLETSLDWRGPEPSNAESASAAVWVLQELLHHLHSCTAGFASFTVEVGTRMQVLVVTPSNAFSVTDGEPDWLLRSRLRLQLAGGTISRVHVADGTAVEIDLP
jgi:hypothetical protein